MNNNNQFAADITDAEESQKTNKTFPIEIIFEKDNEREMVPTIVDKLEFSIWVKKEAGEEAGSRYPTLYELIGEPEFIVLDKLSGIELTDELNRLRTIMQSFDIIIKTFTVVSDEELYRFITCDLFPMLTEGHIILKPAVIIYNEFCPSDEYIIKKKVSDLLRAVLGLEAWKYQWKCYKRILINYKELKAFILNYESFDVRLVEIERFYMDQESASVFFKCNFYGLKNSLFVDYFVWEGECRLHINDGIWYEDYLTLPME